MVLLMGIGSSNWLPFLGCLILLAAFIEGFDRFTRLVRKWYRQRKMRKIGVFDVSLLEEDSGATESVSEN